MSIKKFLNIKEKEAEKSAEEIGNLKIKDLSKESEKNKSENPNGLDATQKSNEKDGVSQSPGREVSVKERCDAVLKYQEDFDHVIFDLRQFRKGIDYIMNIIDLTGLQKAIAKDIESYNPVEHSIVSLIKSKGSIGQLLKSMVPPADIIAFKCYNNYLELCKEFGENPTYEGLFYELPKEFVTNFIETVKRALKDNYTAEENHKNWMYSKLSEGWVWGEEKDTEKKIHPSLISYDQLSESERKKNEEIIRIVNEYKNPYIYPKQTGKDVEEVADKFEVKDLEIVLPEGRYEKNGVPIVHASQLSKVQMVDWIKYFMSSLVDDYIDWIKNSPVRYFINNLNSVHLPDDIIRYTSGLLKNVIYTDLIDAKNLFGYTFQYFK